MAESTVLKCDSDFFNVLVKEGLHQAEVRVSLPVKNYLCQLLRFFIMSDHLFFVNSSGKKQIKPLAELYLQSFKAGPAGLKSNLKKMGDTSLYITGFFRESLKKKLVSTEYYIQMGRQAYKSLSGFQNEELFEELAFHFSDLVLVLFQIRKTSSSGKYKDLLFLLDQYMETGSEQTARDLISQGINIPFKKTPFH